MFQFIDQYITISVMGNKASDLVIFLLIVLVGILLKRFLSPVFSKIVLRIVQRYTKEAHTERYIKNIHRPLGRFIIFSFVYLAFLQLHFPEAWNLKPAQEFGLKLILRKTYQLVLIYAFMEVLFSFINVLGVIFLEKAKLTETKTDDYIVPFLKELIKVLVVIFAVVFTLGNVFNVNVATLVTGLGISGLAVALAGKETLENLFASFTIFLDRPFIVGDLIQVGDIIGRIEKVGFRTTRIRTMERSLITLPNKMMIDQPVDNWNERKIWRMKLDLTLTYSTSREVLYKIKEEIAQYLQEHARTNFDNKVFFSAFGDSSLNLTVFAFIVTGDFFDYQAICDEINFKLHEIVTENGGDFAFPTRTLHLFKEN
ncbi:MAG: mechanosensitive ion channel family protein [Thermonemataceae bacterium]